MTSIDEKTRTKLTRIHELESIIDNASKELAELLNPEKIVARPPDFSINNEVLKIIDEEGGQNVSSGKILTVLQKKFRDYGIDRKQVASALAYLKNTKKQLTIPERGRYSLVRPENIGIIVTDSNLKKELES